MDKGTTKPGFVTGNRLRVVGQMAQPSDTHRFGGRFYALECLRCGALIKSNGCDIHGQPVLTAGDGEFLNRH